MINLYNTKSDDIEYCTDTKRGSCVFFTLDNILYFKYKFTTTTNQLKR